MATRTAQVVIQVDDKSLVELNAEIKTLETSIKNLKIGTTEWVAQNQKLGTLKDRFKQATDEAKKLQGVVQKVTGADMVRSVAKLGAGMVGAFSAASGSLKLLGINSKTFDEMTAKATTLMSIMGGLNQISELFSSTNLKGLKQIGAGFSGLATTVKGFSTATKAALISTGIGALIVGLGLVIANWDKIKNAITGASNKEQESYDKSQKDADTNIKNLTDVNRLLEDRITLLKELDASSPTLSTEDQKKIGIEEATNQLIKNRLDLYDAEIKKREDFFKNPALQKGNDEAKAALDKANKNFEDTVAKYKKYEELFKSTDKLTQTENFIKFGDVKQQEKILENITATATKEEKIVEELNDAYILRIKTQDVTRDELLNLLNERAIYNVIQSDRKKIDAVQNETNKDRNKQIAQLERDLVILNAEQNKEQEIYQAQYDILTKKWEAYQKIIDAGGLLTIQEAEEARMLSAQKQALVLQNEERLKQKKLLEERNKLELENLMYQRELDKIIHDSSILYSDIKNNIDAYSNELNNAGILLEDQVKNAIALQTAFDKIQKIEVEKEKATKLGWSIQKGYVQEKTKELELFIQIQEATKKKLENDKQILINANANLNILIAQKENDIELTQNQLYRNSQLLEQVENELKLAKTSEERITAETKMNTLLSERYKLEENIANLQKGIVDDKDAQVKNNIKIDQTEKSINKTVTDTADKTKEISDDVEKQVKTYKKLQNFVNKYSEEIATASQALLQSMELVSSVFDAQAQRHQDRIDELNNEYETMQNLQAENQDRLLAYEEELKDANGTRYDELLTLIDEAKAKETEAAETEKAHKNEIAQLEYKKLLDERQAALWRKRQAIIEALIQGALAVVKALPNVFLSVAVGVLSAAGIATIAAQKVPDVPKPVQYEKGGFTRKGKNKDVAGIVHANEYVIPADVVGSSKAQHHIAALERQRVRGYAEGGFVAPANSSSSPGFEYEKLSKALINAIKEMPNPQVGLVNISNGLKEVELTKSQAGLTR